MNNWPKIGRPTNFVCCIDFCGHLFPWCSLPDLNGGRDGLQPSALPTELRLHVFYCKRTWHFMQKTTKPGHLSVPGFACVRQNKLASTTQNIPIMEWLILTIIKWLELRLCFDYNHIYLYVCFSMPSFDRFLNILQYC